jgi:L-iditol 2-dehydrogenase
MKAAVLVETGKIDIREIDRPILGRDDLLIKTACAGVCGSDLHAFRGKHPFRKPPVILGHELAGTVVECGSDVQGFRPGDRVTVMPLVACECPNVSDGSREHLPEQAGAGAGAWLGSFAEYALAKASIAYKLAEGTPCELGVLAEPLAVGVHAVQRQARIEPGSRVLVLGGGTIGILTALAARAAGAGDIVATDLFDFNLALTRELCGAATIHAGEAGWEEGLARACPDKFDATFLCSGASAMWPGRSTDPPGRLDHRDRFLEPVLVDLTA